jgi:peroxiredoxin/predicted Ser/Thr protein kinase
VLKPGDLAPEIDALTSTGERFKLSEQKKNLCTVVYFFPKAFTPGCELEARRFRDNYAEITLAGASLVGVSTDDLDTQCRFGKSMRAPFPLIGDADKTISRAYGVLWPIFERPKRVTFIVGAGRAIEAVLHHEIDVPKHATEVLRIVDAMKRRRAGLDAGVETTVAAATVRIVRPGGAEPFEVIREAGAGGMGTVYQARDHATGRVVAVKVLAPEADPARFAREIDVLSRLVHPNVVAYVGHGATEDGRTFLAMEWLDGESLGSTLARGPLDVRESARVAREVAAGLAAAHAAGVIHRDVKPSNVLVTSDGAVKILDFGVARPAEKLATALTRTGQVVGTPAYMAPEQARSDRTIDARTDLFALGCLLFRCVMGRRPFEGSDVMELLQNVIAADAPRLEGVPPALEELCAQLLEKEMDARPSSAAEVVGRLDAILRTIPLGASRS